MNTILTCLFLSLLNKQAGQTFSSYLDGPRTEAEVSQTTGSITPVKLTYVTAGQTGGTLSSAPRTFSEVQVIERFLLIAKPATSTDSPHESTRSALPIVPSAAARSSSVINDSATPLSSILQIPHSSFFQSLSHFQLAASLLSISSFVMHKTF